MLLGEVRPRAEAEGCGAVTAAQAAGHGEERTWNMDCMVVTLEVSKLSGWLNADAFCRESKEGHAVRGEGAGQQTGVQRAGEGLDCRLGAGHAGRSARRTCRPWL